MNEAIEEGILKSMSNKGQKNKENYMAKKVVAKKAAKKPVKKVVAKKAAKKA